MSERVIRNVQYQKRLRQRQCAWVIVGWLLLAVMALVFLGGVFVGSAWQKEEGKKISLGDSLVNSDPISGSWENAVYDIQGNVTQYNETQDEVLPNQDTVGIDVSDTQWNLTLVNKWNPVPDNYEVNLVELEGGEYVDERIYQPLMQMLEDAREANWEQLPRVVSGYRTTEKQQQLYDDKIAEYRKQGYSDDEAESLAQQWVAVPGYSEHQLGFAVDINGATYDVYLWLQENSYKYGFIFRYPGSKTDLTGVAEEVWHYRYVGIEAAAKIHEQGICLEEYNSNMSLNDSSDIY